MCEFYTSVCSMVDNDTCTHIHTVSEVICTYWLLFRLSPILMEGLNGGRVSVQMMWTYQLAISSE